MLATTEAHKMLPTIVSRCQRFDFKRLQVPEIIKKLEFILKKENVKFESSALSLISLNARGSFRDAESLLDKCISFSGGAIKTKDLKELLGIVEIGQISKLLDFIVVRNTKEAISYINSLAEEGVDLQEFAKTLVFYQRQSLLLKINPNFLNPETSGFSAEELEKMKAQTANLSENEVRKILESFIEAENKMKYATILQLPLELAIVDLTAKES
jgi:DNA polymerase-3 subunit gamma/tau